MIGKPADTQSERDIDRELHNACDTAPRWFESLINRAISIGAPLRSNLLEPCSRWVSLGS